MENINDCYEFIRLLANKNQQGHLSPGQFNRAFNAAEMQFFNENNGPIEGYQPGRPVPPLAYGMTRTVNDNLDPFVRRVQFVPTSAVPFWTRPANYVHALSLIAAHVPTATRSTAFVDAEEVPHASLGGRLSSRILRPSLSQPIVTFGAGQMEVYPATVPGVTVTYLSYPVLAKWVGTLTNGRLVYTPATSLQPQWPRSTWNELCVRTASFLGMNLKAQDVVQYAEMKKVQGT